MLDQLLQAKAAQRGATYWAEEIVQNNVVEDNLFAESTFQCFRHPPCVGEVCRAVNLITTLDGLLVFVI